MNIPHYITQELNKKFNQKLEPRQIIAAISLLDNGDTVPFIARYRKEVTQGANGVGLSDTDLRFIEETLRYCRELEERRETILKSIDEQGKLTDELKTRILEVVTKTELEDLYLPYKPKRRTKAQIAREAGLEPLALALWNDATLAPEEQALTYLNPELNFPDIKSVLDGARAILMEMFSENADLLAELRDYLWHYGRMRSVVITGKEEAGKKFTDYFDFQEALHKIPSHRMLALLRGSAEEVLRINVEIEQPEEGFNACEGMIAKHHHINLSQRTGFAADGWLQDVVRWTWKVKLYLQLETEMITRLREQSEAEAIKVFGQNLHDLLLAAPAGTRATLGLDPGLRTGVKVAVVDHTGKLLEYTAVFPHLPQRQWNEALDVLGKLCRKHHVQLISIGNGTASRETDQLAAELIKRHPDLGLTKIVVSEAGASVYSASELASKEFPDVDVSYRGAVSIARRLQDPLAELVKIDPKSIGVGQYQHDVNQFELARQLDKVVEDCVNAVGVDLNMASVPLLARISGLNETIARNIVEFRNAQGVFKSRQDLLKVPRLGQKTFEQAAGFLRISQGENPLDGSSVHPEAYPLVQKILEKSNRDLKSIVGDASFLRKINPVEYVDEKFGVPTITDILRELEKPGRDPRPEFKTATFKDGVEEIKDLKPGMVLEGVVTNVTNFGAFVDIGVHQDGLVHISALSDKFVQDPRTVVKAGDIVTAKVLEVDAARKRIALTLRLGDTAAPRTSGSTDRKNSSVPRSSARSSAPVQPPMENALSAALAQWKKG